MDAFKTFFFLFLFVFKTFDDVDCDCILSLQKDFGSPSPVFLRKNTFLAPDDSGAIILKRSDIITVACPGNKRLIVLGNTTSSYNVLEAHCILNSTFRVDRWTGPFKNIRCTGQPVYSTLLSDKPCYRPRHDVDRAQRYRVGYQVKSQFHALYEACFDPTLLRTRYVQHTLSPSSRYMQPGSKRPQFTEGNLFGKVRMSQIYKMENQKTRINAILGNNMGDQYITKKQFLTRGHLAPRADYVLHAENRASFHYVNAAPQWMRGNAGDWAALEDALRRRVQSLGRAVTVRTGTHGTVTLPDAHHRPHDVYLHADDNNNLLVPVPLYFYKLVYDSKEKKATAFVSINSSYYNATTIRKLTFCNDVCEDNPSFSWLKWRSNDGTFSFCCDYEEFRNVIDYFDKLDVNGWFY